MFSALPPRWGILRRVAETAFLRRWMRDPVLQERNEVLRQVAQCA